MSQDRVEFIKRMQSEGRSTEQIRQEVLSQGFAADGFEADLEAAKSESEDTELGIQEPAPDSTERQPSTMPTIQNVPLIGFGELLAQSLVLAKSNLRLVGAFTLALLLVGVGGLLLLGIGFLTFLVAASLALTLGQASTVLLIGVGIVLYLLWIMALAVVGIALVYALVHRKQQASYWQGVKWCLKNIWAVFLVSLLAQLVVSGGYIFLFVPGIALAFYTLFVMFVLTSGEERGLSALLRSTDLVYGKWWGVFGRILGLGLLIGLGIGLTASVLLAVVVASGEPAFMALVFLFVAIGYLLAILWMTAAMTLLFESLQARKPHATYSVAHYSTLKTIYTILAVIGFFVLIIWNVVGIYQAAMEPGAASSERSMMLDDYRDGEENLFTDEEFEAEIRRLLEEEVSEQIQ